MSVLQSPKLAPPFYLRALCARILPRLRLIPEFETWLDLPCNHNDDSHFSILWECFVLGAPLCTLLDLLGPPAGCFLNMDVKNVCVNANGAQREAYVARFIQCVQILETQGRLPYGEVLKADDLFGGTFAGFAKVLRTVERVLSLLQATYPGLFFLPSGSQCRRRELLFELLDSERIQVMNLTTLADSAASLMEVCETRDTLVDCFAMNCGRLLPFHRHVLDSMEENFLSSDICESWDQIFALDSQNDLLYTTAVCAYKSHCADYLRISPFLERQSENMESAAGSYAKKILNLLSDSLHRISDYRRLLQIILDVTSPAQCQEYDSLCLALLKITDFSMAIDEIGRQVRTMWTTNVVKEHAHVSGGVNTDQLGDMLLDDCVFVDGSGHRRYLFLFDKVMLCCQHSDGSEDDANHPVRICYPIFPWEVGPAARRIATLTTLYAIPTSNLRAVCYTDLDSFEVDWEYKDSLHTLVFSCVSAAQCEQWYSTLQPLLPPSPRAHRSGKLGLVSDDGHSWSQDEAVEGRRRSRPKAWSVIARRGQHSESSSLLNTDNQHCDLLLSPDTLPLLFYGSSEMEPRSPLSINTTLPHSMEESTPLTDYQMPPTPSPTSGTSTTDGASALVLDLTSQVIREGNYPVAQGGFADVWRGIWHCHTGDSKVAVKVLRSRVDDPEVEMKMKKRLRRELCVWKRMDHENVLQLYGTVADFGPYTAMVCPWMSNGSVSKYLERRGDVVTLADRLQLLCEVAAGLSYLHSHGVIHGDLTGSNILIDDDGKARLCDFGLSSIVAEFKGTSYLTSSLGGAIRWAAAELYRVYDDGYLPTVSTHSDIYSFGSVMLEILSGRIPYYYMRTDAQVVIELNKGVKPRRPVDTHVTNAHWNFIQRCWADAVEERPAVGEVLGCIHVFLQGAKEYRRHTV